MLAEFDYTAEDASTECSPEDFVWLVHNGLPRHEPAELKPMRRRWELVDFTHEGEGDGDKVYTYARPCEKSNEEEIVIVRWPGDLPYIR